MGAGVARPHSKTQRRGGLKENTVSPGKSPGRGLKLNEPNLVMNEYEASFDHGNGKGGNHLDKDLSEIRRKIRLLDHEILGNLTRRIQLAKQAGAVKHKQNKPLRDEEQEEKVIEHLKTWTPLLEVSDEMVEEVWETLFKHCLEAQKPTDVPDPDPGTSEYWWLKETENDDWEVVRVDGQGTVHATTERWEGQGGLPGTAEWEGPIEGPAEWRPMEKEEAVDVFTKDE